MRPSGAMATSPRRISRRTAVRRHLDGEQIVAMAAEIADAEGLDNLTMTRVAAGLGVSPQALYRHVNSHDALLRGMALRSREMLAQRLANAAVGRSGRDAVAAVGRAWREEVRNNPGMHAAAERFRCSGDAELEAAVARVCDVLGQSLRAYGLADVDETRASRALLSTLHGFSHLELGDGHPLPYDPDDTFTLLVEVLCNGIEQLRRNSGEREVAAS